MLQKLKSIFRSKKEVEKLPVPGKCLVDIELAGQSHTFFQNAEFAEQLAKALPTGGIFSYKTEKGGYLINLVTFRH